MNVSCGNYRYMKIEIWSAAVYIGFFYVIVCVRGLSMLLNDFSVVVRCIVFVFVCCVVVMDGLVLFIFKIDCIRGLGKASRSVTRCS